MTPPPGAATAAARKPGAARKPAARVPSARPVRPPARKPPAGKAPARKAPDAKPKPKSKQARPARPSARPPARRGAGTSLARSGRTHRRVSGAAGPRGAGAALASALPALPNLPQLRAPQLPSLRTLPSLRPVPVLGALGAGAFRVGRSLPRSPLVDRLVRGRGWIGLLAFLLFGLVALNVSLLKMNAEAGRNAEQVKSLRIANDRLHAQVSRLAGGDRLDRVAGRLGLVMPEPGSVHYLTVRPGDAERAAKAIANGRRSPVDGPLQDGVLSTPSQIAPVVPAPATLLGPTTTQTPTAATGAAQTPTGTTGQAGSGTTGTTITPTTGAAPATGVAPATAGGASAPTATGPAG